MSKLDELYNKMVLLIGLGKTFSSSNFKEDFKFLQNLLRREIKNSHDKNFIEEGNKILLEIEKTPGHIKKNEFTVMIPKVGDYVTVKEKQFTGRENFHDDISPSVLFEMIKQTCEYL